MESKADTSSKSSAILKDSSFFKPFKYTKFRICKNLVMISSAFLFVFIAFNGLSMLQSTMNKKQGMGIMSQAAVYVGFISSSLVLPKYCVKKLGCKKTLLLGISLFIPYIASNFYPAWSTLIPAGFLCGIGGSILWGSQSTYFNISSFLYCTVAQGVLIEDQENNIATNSNCTSIEELSLEDTITQNDQVDSFENINVQSQNKFQSSGKSMSTYDNSEELSVSTIKNVFQEAVTMTYFRRRSSGNEQGFFPPKELKEDFRADIKALQSNITPISELTQDNLDAKISINALAKIEKITPLFFGFHGLMFHSSMIWSNMMSYFVLKNDEFLSNITSNITQNFSCACGASFCNGLTNCGDGLISEPTLEMRYLLTGISVLLGLVGFFLVLLFLDKIDSTEEEVTFSLDIMAATFSQGKNIKQIFLIPLSIFVGMEQGFYIGDYTKSFIACSMGTSNVGLVTIFYGITCALSSTLSGGTVRLVGRIPIFIVAEIINVGTSVYFLWWTPNPNEPYMFFLGALLWGSFTGIFWSQLPALTGILFMKNKEAAFAFYYMCMSSGYAIMFVCSDLICTNYKIYFLLVISTLGIIGFLITEYLHYTKKEN